jgi:SagB-type dehydrogenase family enzyme
MGETARDVWRRLRVGPVPFTELATDTGEQSELLRILRYLWHEGQLAMSWPTSAAEVEILPAVPGWDLDFTVSLSREHWKLSRFAVLRRGDEPDMVIAETPVVPVTMQIRSPLIGRIFVALGSPITLEDAGRALGVSQQQASGLLLLLRLAGIIVPGSADLREDYTLGSWEFHDLLFHVSSRLGRHRRRLGAEYRLQGRIPAPPPLKPRRTRSATIPLPVPDLEAIAASEPSFTTVLESRRSIRAHDPHHPISVAQIGEFLYRTARIRQFVSTDVGIFTSRPYPNGGASYELELYLAVDRSADLPRGMYYYDAAGHWLVRVAEPTLDFEGLLRDAWVSAAGLCRPQVLITVASRFRRVAWKYSGIAYAAQLKNVGVLYQTMYLVATAMGLAGCALGLGDSQRFARVTDTEFFEEGSIGEFMLGTVNPAAT